MTDLTELLAQVESAKAPDRSLDALICAAFRYFGNDQPGIFSHGSRIPPEWVNWPGEVIAVGDRVVLLPTDGAPAHGPWTKAEYVTLSVDAAWGLAHQERPDWTWSAHTFDDKRKRRAFASLRPPFVPALKLPDIPAWAATPALALCAAIIKAKIAEESK